MPRKKTAKQKPRALYCAWFLFGETLSRGLSRDIVIFLPFVVAVIWDAIGTGSLRGNEECRAVFGAFLYVRQ